jgi:NADH dehydrogenase FAD-containing subunit
MYVLCRALNANGIKVTLQTSVKNVSAEHITLIDESGAEYEYKSDLVIFTAGTEQSPFIKAIQAEKVTYSDNLIAFLVCI